MSTEPLAVPKALAPVAEIVNTALSAGKTGAVVARAGVGKTSFLVQAALYAMMSGKNVLHINLADTVKKTVLWYEEVFSLMTAADREKGAELSLAPLLSRRLIMTMKIDGFSVDGVRERLMDIIEQGVFWPHLIVFDGLSFDSSRRETVTGIRELGVELSLCAWVSVPAHRQEERDKQQRPRCFADVADLFDVAWELLPDGKKITVRALPAGASGPLDPGLFLNPSTMLLDIRKD